MTRPPIVRPNIVEGQFFAGVQRGRGFDKLSPNGVGLVRDFEVLA